MALLKGKGWGIDSWLNSDNWQFISKGGKSRDLIPVNTLALWREWFRSGKMGNSKWRCCFKSNSSLTGRRPWHNMCLMSETVPRQVFIFLTFTILYCSINFLDGQLYIITQTNWLAVICIFMRITWRVNINLSCRWIINPEEKAHGWSDKSSVGGFQWQYLPNVVATQ